MLSTQQLNHSVETTNGTLTILKNINLEIQRGESAAITGASGAGKSTLLGMLAGLDIPSSGKVMIDTQDITSLNEEARAAMRLKYVAFVFQNFQLMPSLNALENVALPLEVKRETQANKKAEQFLQRVGLENRLKHLPAQLSGGEQQRVAIARAFACRAPIVFADEPTGNLDTLTGDQISDLLFDVNREHDTTLVLVTHSLKLAQRCDRVFHMSAGELSEEREQPNA
jgi:putative ABC transport system ATP-binding protein